MKASSNIESAKYDADTETLTVTFKSGGTYTYPGVSAEVWEAFDTADSPGSYFHSHIRGKFDGAKA